MIRSALAKLLGRPAAARRPAFRPAVEALEVRLTPAVRTVGAGMQYASIQAAVNAAAAGDTINVAPGTYTETVTVGAGKNNLTLHSTTPYGAVVQSPNVAGIQGLLVVRGALNVTIDGFQIQGPAFGNSHSLEAGILIDSGGSATITNNRIEHIHGQFLSGSQDGVGIAVGATYTHTNNVPFQFGRATITNNIIDDYQKGGIFVTGFNSYATIGGANPALGNQITGQVGGTSLLSEFGIQVSDRAGADIENNSISNNIYTGPGFSVTGFAAGFGIALVSLTPARAGQVIVKNNLLFANDDSIFGSGITLATITGNSTGFPVADTRDGIELINAIQCTISNNITAPAGNDGIALSGNSFLNTISGNSNLGLANGHDGIFLAATTYQNTITRNTYTGNVNFDLEDLSVGSGTAGTANTWSGNTFTTSNPAGLM